MTQQHTRLSLTNYNFPLLSTGVGASIILPSRLDVPQAVVGGQREPAMLPELIYCENLIPTTEGYRSCYFTQVIAPAGFAENTLKDAYRVSDSSGLKGLLSIGGDFLNKDESGTWVALGGAGVLGTVLSHANVAGQSYIQAAGSFFWRIDVLTATKVLTTLVGVSANLFKNICASGNYLIGATDTTIYWSSPTNPIDFTPSTFGGGSSIPSDLKGTIVKLVPVTKGFLILTTENIVSATATGNTQFPWIFAAVAGGAGTALYEGNTLATQVVADNLLDSVIVWTTAGLQEVSIQGAAPILPEFTDFIRTKITETYSATGALEQSFTSGYKVKINQLDARFMIFSYGRQFDVLEFALIFDASLKRWGKVKLNHTAAILMPTAFLRDAFNQICFIKTDGSVVRLLADGESPSLGVAVFGRLALTRSSTTTIQSVKLESPRRLGLSQTTDPVIAKLVTSYKGGQSQDSFKALTGTPTGQSINFPALVTGEAHQLHLTGSLNLTSLVVTTTQGGTR